MQLGPSPKVVSIMSMLFLLLIFCTISSGSSSMSSARSAAASRLLTFLETSDCVTIVSADSNNPKENGYKPLVLVDKNHDNIVWCDWVLLFVEDEQRALSYFEEHETSYDMSSYYVVITERPLMNLELGSKLPPKTLFLSPINEEWLVWSRPNWLLPFAPCKLMRSMGTERHEVEKCFGEDTRDGVKFSGQLVIGSTFHYVPYNRLNEAKEIVGGYEGKIVDLMIKSLNLSLKVQIPSDGGMWGNQVPRGSGNFTGIVGDVQFGRADLAFAYLFVVPSRQRQIDFSTWYVLDPNCAIVQKPHPIAKILVAILPFDLVTWVLFLFMVILSFAFYYLHAELRRDLKQLHRANVLPLLMAMMSSQSQRIIHLSFSNSFRIGSVTMILVIMVLSNSYGGSLTSLMAKDIMMPRIDTFKQMEAAFEEQRITSIIVCCPNFLTEMKAHPSPHVRALGKVATVDRNYGRYIRYWKAVDNPGLTTFFYSKLSLQFVIQEHLSDQYGNTNVHITQECLQPSIAALGLQKRSYFKSSMDRKLLEMQEAGFVQKFIRDERELVGLTKGQLTQFTDESEILTLDEAQVPLIILCSMLTLSVSIFGVEMLRGPRHN